MDTTTLGVGLVLFLSVFTQSLSGFGIALVAMALLPPLVGIQVATPLVAVEALILEVVLVIYYRESLQVGSIWRVVLAAVIATPLGVFFLSSVDERISLALLGVVISGYALYALAGLALPKLSGAIWAYLAGLLGGLLGGAYNTSGPPVIIYGDASRWPPRVFKGNLQGYFIIVSLAVLTGHALKGNLTPQIWALVIATAPYTVFGILAGLSLDRWLNPLLFRRIVLVLLVLMGLRLVF